MCKCIKQAFFSPAWQALPVFTNISDDGLLDIDLCGVDITIFGKRQGKERSFHCRLQPTLTLPIPNGHFTSVERECELLDMWLTRCLTRSKNFGTYVYVRAPLLLL